MWLCLNSAFFSVVHKDCAPDELLVRARRKGDIEKVFPGAKVITKIGTDYQFRAAIKREVVAATITEHLLSLEYSNFKNSVKDDRLHSAYNGIWGIMARLQPSPPYSRSRAQRGLL